MAISSLRPSCSLSSLFSISSFDTGITFTLSSTNNIYNNNYNHNMKKDNNIPNGVVFALSLLFTIAFFVGVSIIDVFALSSFTCLGLDFSISLLIISYDSSISPIGRSSSPSSYNGNETSVIDVGNNFKFNL